MKDLSERWRQKLCTFLAEVIALEQAVDLISQGYFEGHDVLFGDIKEQLTSSHQSALDLIAGYNWFAAENSREHIDLNDDHGAALGRRVEQFLNEWVMLSRSKALSAQGKVFEARDEVLCMLNPGRGIARAGSGGSLHRSPLGLAPFDPLYSTVPTVRTIR